MASLASSCPLRAYDTVTAVRANTRVIPVLTRDDLKRKLTGLDSIEVKVDRRSDSLWVKVPVSSAGRADRIGYFLVGAFLSAVALLICLSAYAASRTILSLAALGVCACVGVSVISLLSGLQSTALDVTSTLALAFLPATIWHLTLLFPTRTELARRVPGVVPPLYLAAAALGTASISASYLRAGIRFLTISEQLLAFALACGFATLGWRCAKEVFAPRTALHHAQARGLLLSLLAVVGIPSALAWISPSLGVNRAEMIAIGIMLTPIPVAYLASRSTLHQIGVRARVVATYGFQSVIMASLCVLAVFVSNRLLDLPTSFGNLGSLWVLGSAVSLALSLFFRPHQAIVSQRIAPLSRAVVGAGTEASAGKYLQKSLEQALRPSSFAAFVQDAGIVRRLEGCNTTSFDEKLAEVAVELLDESEHDSFLNLSSHPIDSPFLRHLHQSGISLIASLDSERKRSVLLLGAPRGWPTYDSTQIAELAQICANGSLALEYSWLSEERASSAFHAARGLVAAQVAHDLRNPIETIRSVARREGHQAEALLADDATQIIDMILGRMSQGAQALEDLIKEVVADYIGLIGEDRFLLRLTNNLPDIAAPTDLKRVLRNLLDNALAASPQSESVEIFAARRNERAIIEVIDFGRGMSLDEQHQAFDPLYTTKPDGTGLGLSSCRAIISGLGGRISLTSEPGEGTRVRLELPDA